VLFAWSYLSHLSPNRMVTKDPTAMAIAQQAMTAMGGLASASYQDSTATGSITFYSDTGMDAAPITLESKETIELRQDIQRGQSTDTYVANGQTACLTRSTDSRLDDILTNYR